MNSQEIFDTVATHLFKQGHRAYDEVNDKCCYRAPDGSMCAVGCLIQDYYDPNMEINPNTSNGLPVDALPTKFNLPKWIGQNLSLLRSLQNAHDDEYFWSSPEALKKHLKKVAKLYSLNPSVLDNLNKFGE